MLKSFDDLYRALHDTAVRGKTKLIAIDGRGGSGKSTLARKIAALDPTISIAQVDWFPCRPSEHPFHRLHTQTRVSTARIRDELLIPLIEGRGARFYRSYWWESELCKEEEIVEIPAGGTVLVEGCYALDGMLLPLYDLKIFLSCSVDVALQRTLKRDGEKDRLVWETAYIPNETRYIEAQKPELVADFVIDDMTLSAIVR
jgi:uridine kinase